jgi:spermidine synthase
LKKVLSFILPNSIKKGTTSLGQEYEIAYEYGRKVLNSANANYSFGSLHEVMQKGIAKYLKNNNPSKVLILGLGAGSCVEILHRKCRNTLQLKAIEIDSDIIEFAKEYFDIGQYSNVEIINGDAQYLTKYLYEDINTFDLIIDDVFWDNQIPNFCFQKEYIEQAKILLKEGGCYFRNVMETDSNRVLIYESLLEEEFSRISKTDVLKHSNKIYLCYK